LEPLRAGRKLRASGEPDAALAFYDTLIIHDYAHKSTKIISVAGPEGIETVYRAVRESLRKASREPVREPTEPPASLLRAATSPHPAHTARVRSNLSRDAYIAAVRRIKDHIFAGDIYQANLTQRFRYRLAPSTGPEQIFWRLRRDHPASFAAFIRRRDDVVISASPERFLRVRTGSAGRQIEAWPIKGTRPRGVNQDEDARLCRELLASEKDRAENIMIVDLVRNDLGRVCCYGSVEVTELCSIQEHPTLFHLVSKVRGTLRREATAGDILRATFPCGSITGAPKIRAMEIISEVEPSARGLSMGAIGYFSFDGAMDLNVAIRTMVIRDRVARFNTGGGIVADSDPALEYEESLVKARALLRALKDEKMPER
jgi:para-aminobenzoate synthetase component 1